MFEFEQIALLLKDRFQLCLEDEESIPAAKTIKAKYFLATIVRDFFTLNHYIALGVSAVRITAPLTHYFKSLSNFTDKVEFRIFPNQTFIKPEKFFDGVTGGWFRPEDLSKANDVISVVEFLSTDNIKREQALFRIYSQKKEWPGEVYLLIDGIADQHIINSYLPPNFFERRSNCHQKCQQGKNCHFCAIVAGMAKEEFVKQAKNQIKKLDK